MTHKMPWDEPDRIEQDAFDREEAEAEHCSLLSDYQSALDQVRQDEIATRLAQHHQSMPDEVWLEYYAEIGFPIPAKTTEEKIMAAVHFDAAESGLLPDWFYEQ